MINLFACAAGQPSNDALPGTDASNRVTPQKSPEALESAKPVKSPHGYIITRDHDLGRFGGFVGDCTDDQNWPYFWKCMSENAGNGGFK